MTQRFAPVRRIAFSVFQRLTPRTRRRVVQLLTPNYTIGAVTVVRDNTGAILLLRQPPGNRGWSLPGGLLNRHEEPIRGAARELREETGLIVDSGQIEPMHPNALINAVAHQVDMVFTATVGRDDALLNIDPVEVLEARWFPLEELPQLTRATARLLGNYDIGPLAVSE